MSNPIAVRISKLPRNTTTEDIEQFVTLQAQYAGSALEITHILFPLQNGDAIVQFSTNSGFYFLNS